MIAAMYFLVGLMFALLLSVLLAGCTLEQPRGFDDQVRTLTEQHLANCGMGPQL